MSSLLISQQNQIAINSWYRLLWSGIKIFRDCRHFKLHELLDFAYTQFDQPADYTAKQSLFPDCRIRYIQQSKKRLGCGQHWPIYDGIFTYTDSSSKELGVDAGMFVDHVTKDHSAAVDEPNHSIPLSNTSTIFQIEMLAISTASVSLLSIWNQNSAFITDSLSAMQSLLNPVYNSDQTIQP